MAKPEWGIKRTCHICGKKYYDLNKSQIICPSCGAEFDPDYYLKTKKGRSVSSKNSSENDNELTNDIENIDNIAVDSDNEVVSDDDPLMEINKEDQNAIEDEEIGLDDDISFIEDDEVSDDNSVDIETNEEDKN